MLAYALAAGLIFGLYFALVGVGMNLVFGVMRIVNLAHGDFVMLGGHPVPLLGQTVPYAWVYAAGVSVLMLAGVYLYLYQSRIGRQTRAIIAQREEALAIGVDIHWISAIAFGVGSGLAAVAGVFAPFMLGSFTPSIGLPLDLTSFAVIIIGSLGNPLGTVLGGVIFGVCLMLMRTYLSSFADLLPNLVLIGVLLVKPTGLLGRRVRHA